MFLSFDGEDFGIVQDSHYSHLMSFGLGNYRGAAFTTGCDHYGKNCFNKTEILNMQTLEWSEAPDYPFAE